MNSKGLLVQTKSGKDNTTNYDKTGVGAYWPFANTAFVYHILPAPTEKTDPKQ